MLLGKSQFRVSEGIDLMSRIASSSISLAGSEERINFSQQSPKMLKMASKSFIHALLLLLGLSLKISPLGAPDATMMMVIFRAWATCAVKRD